MKYKVLTLNIHKGFSTGNAKFTLKEIRDCLRLSQSNIVFLQEIIGENQQYMKSVNGWPDKNQMEFLADSVWEHFAYGKNAIYEHGHHGNAILSEVPFSWWKNIDVTASRFSDRGILHGKLINGIHLICIHFGLFEKERSRQLRMLMDHIHENVPGDAPLIVAGDFNDWRGTLHKELVSAAGFIESHQSYTNALPRTFPAFFPLLTMDRIYVRNMIVSHAEILGDAAWSNVSDHRALTCTLHTSNPEVWSEE